MQQTTHYIIIKVAWLHVRQASTQHWAAVHNVYHVEQICLIVSVVPMWIFSLAAWLAIVIYIFRSGLVLMRVIVRLAIWAGSTVCLPVAVDWLSVLFVRERGVFSARLTTPLTGTSIVSSTLLLLPILLLLWPRCLCLFPSSLPALWLSSLVSSWDTTTPKCSRLFSYTLLLAVFRSFVWSCGLGLLYTGTITSHLLFLWSVWPMHLH